jgi:ammonia channel protein AmtB
LLILKVRIDDAVDAFAGNEIFLKEYLISILVHGGCGVWGLLASGLFATKNYTKLAFNRSPNFDDWGVSYIIQNLLLLNLIRFFMEEVENNFLHNVLV